MCAPSALMEQICPENCSIGHTDATHMAVNRPTGDKCRRTCTEAGSIILNSLANRKTPGVSLGLFRLRLPNAKADRREDRVSSHVAPKAAAGNDRQTDR